MDTLPPRIMEVESGPIVEETSLAGTHSPLNHDHGRKSSNGDVHPVVIWSWFGQNQQYES